MRLLSLSLLGVLVSGPAFAQAAAAAETPPVGAQAEALTNPPPASAPIAPTATPVSAPLPVSDPGWQAAFEASRDQLLGGQFADAERSFDDLAAHASSPADRRAATELGSLAAAWRLRNNVLALGPDARVRTTDEVASLYIYAAAYGAGTGLWLSNLADAKSSAGVLLPALSLTAAGIGAVAAFDNLGSYKLKYGAPQAIVSGMTIGLVDGALISAWHESVPNRSKWSSARVEGVLWAGATAGALAGGLAGHFSAVTPGRASWVGSGGLWSGVVVELLSLTIAGNTIDASTNFATLLVAYNAGLAAGVLTAKSASPSVARVRFLDLGGVLGGFMMGGLYLAVAGNGGGARVGSAVTGLGVLGGLGGAWALTRGMEGDRIEDRLVPEKSTSFHFAPTVSPVPGGMTGGVGGTF